MRRRPRQFDRRVRRRREIELHARLVGAADTDDLDRWLIAWVWHNKSKDQIGAVIECARRMGRRGMTEQQAAAIIEEAKATAPEMSADRLAQHLGMTYEQRTILGITTIGSIDADRQRRKELRRERRRERDRLATERRRRARGVKARAAYEAQSLSRTKPWERLGISRAQWYRRALRDRAGQSLA